MSNKKKQKPIPKKEKDREDKPGQDEVMPQKSDDVKEEVDHAIENEAAADTTAALEARISELEDQLLRERAETENFKRRTKQEYETNMKYANQSLVEQFLPVLDAFDRALTTSETTDKETKQFLKGFQMIEDLLKQTLERAGLSVIPTVGEQFDPYLHQAVAQDTDEAKPDHEILEELQKGYKLKDRVIRASMVKTNKK